MRFSVSDLETWRRYKEDEDQDIGVLLRRLAHVDPPTPATLAGRALAKWFEAGHEGEHESAYMDGWTFDFAIDGSLSLPRWRELPTEKTFATPSGPATLSGRVDGYDGYTVRDQKLTERWEADRYADSMQWRAYLSMLGAGRFMYDVFEAKIVGSKVRVSGFQQLGLWRYPALDQDVAAAVGELAEVFARHGAKIELLKTEARKP